MANAGLSGEAEDRQKLLSEVDFNELPESQPLRPRYWLNHTNHSSTLFALSLILSALLGALGGSLFHFHLDTQCARHTSMGSPVLEEVDMSYNTIRFNGSLLKENAFRQGAGPVVDEAWQSLGVDYRSVAVTYDEGIRAGMLPDQVKINRNYGGGFVANVEGLHQLHCLNVLRQSLYWNFEYYHDRGEGPFANSDHILHLHVTHCLDILRQALMCSVDVGVLGQVWFNPHGSSPTGPEPYVDFNTRHVCKDFERVRRWAEARQLPDEVPQDFLEPPKEGDMVYEELP